MTRFFFLALVLLSCSSTTSDPAASDAGPAPQPADDAAPPPSPDAGPPDASATVDAAPKYPAFTVADPPQVVSSGGPVLTAPTIVPVFFADDDPTVTGALASFVSKVVQTKFWRDVTSEYGVGTASARPPIYLGKSDAPPSTLDDAEIRKWLAGKLEANDAAFGTPDANTLYTLFYPHGVTITKSGLGTGCQQFGGYHGDVRLDAAHNDLALPYAVIVRCDGALNGLTGVDALTETTSHELLEASTDPLPTISPAYIRVDTAHLGWQLLLEGGEIGDMCIGRYAKLDGLDHVVQRGWSNASIRAGHDPCLLRPPGAGAYFNSVPTLGDRVPIPIGGQTFKVEGVRIALGASATVEVNLFSDAPTSGPWTLDAIDGAAAAGGTPELSFAFDKTTGQNGDVVHLTITVLAKGTRGYETFAVKSKLGDETNIWPGVVTN